jgi:hypothetical protein
MPPGHHYEPIDQYQKDRFLELLEQGYKPDEAARMLNQTGTRFRRLRNPDSVSYDEQFSDRYDQIMRPGGEHEENLAERLEAAAIERGIDKSDRLLEKALVVYNPRWRVFRPANINLGINIEQLKVMLPFVSDETLDRMIREAEAQKQLPAGEHPDIEAA